MSYFIEQTAAAVSPIGDFLKHLPDVAASPLAFVAYCLVVVGWVTTFWLHGQPARKAAQILRQFHHDDARLSALQSLTGIHPPPGLVGNAAILKWVETSTRNRTKLLYLIAWAITLVSVLVFVVAWRTTQPKEHTVELLFQRDGTVGECPDLGSSARFALSVGNHTMKDLFIVGNCHATVVLRGGVKGSATLTLDDANGYALTYPDLQYQMGLDHWDVYVGPSDKSRLRLSLFDYSGDCPPNSETSQTLQALLRSKVNSLRRIFTYDDHRFDYLEQASLVAAGQPLTLSPQQLQQYLVRTASFQGLSGICFKDKQKEMMRSQVFDGVQRGNLAEPLVADLPIIPQEFANTRDIYTASMLYALAEDALARDLDKDVVIEYLQQAREKSSQIHQPAGAEVTRAIDATLAKLGAQEGSRIE